MKIDELIKELQELKERHGNLDVYFTEEDWYGITYHEYTDPPLVTFVTTENVSKIALVV